MLDKACEALDLVRGRSRTDDDSDKALRLALAHLVQNTGEAAGRSSREYQAAHAEIPWRNIVGIRQEAVHDYLYVDCDTVWDAVTADLPELVTGLQRLAPPARIAPRPVDFGSPPTRILA
ncbi:DUF86 domain-containing protein [candidate division WOR-3 bacterium]|nr:DUF86 domain-containing protein [candidate division WOR-3 bacterium]